MLVIHNQAQCQVVRKPLQELDLLLSNKMDNIKSPIVMEEQFVFQASI